VGNKGSSEQTYQLAFEIIYGRALMSMQVVNPAEIEAVKRDEIEGDVYQDGEVFADEHSLEAYRKRQAPPPSSEAA
jgi:hypothetical protein